MAGGWSDSLFFSPFYLSIYLWSLEGGIQMFIHSSCLFLFGFVVVTTLHYNDTCIETEFSRKAWSLGLK